MTRRRSQSFCSTKFFLVNITLQLVNYSHLTTTLCPLKIFVYRCHQKGRIFVKALLDDEAKESSRKELEQELEGTCDWDFKNYRLMQ